MVRSRLSSKGTALTELLYLLPLFFLMLIGMVYFSEQFAERERLLVEAHRQRMAALAATEAARVEKGIQNGF